MLTTPPQFPQRDAARPQGNPHERVTPQSYEAEQSTLGAMMMEQDSLSCAAGILEETDFYREMHRIIYAAILKADENGKGVDMITVTDVLRSRGQLESVGGTEYLSALIYECPSAANVEAYAGTVKDKAILRQLASAADSIQAAAYSDVEDVQALVGESEKKIFEIGARQTAGDGFVSISAISNTESKKVFLASQNPGKITGKATGFYELDEMTGGLQDTDLIIVAARPSMGKTASVLQMALNIAKGGHAVAGVSLEMSKEQLWQRLICSEARVKSQDLRGGFLKGDEWDRVDRVTDMLDGLPLFIDDSPMQTTSQIRARALRLAMKNGGLGMLFIDYLQLARVAGKQENRVNEVSQIARDFKALAKEIKCPIVALSQLSRAVEQREDKRPMLSDLRESGSIEAEADVVAFIYRPAYYRRKALKDAGVRFQNDIPPEEMEEDDIAEIIIGKQRNGPTGTAQMLFQADFAKFVNRAF